MDNNDIKIKKFLHEGENVAKIFGGYDFRGPYKNLNDIEDTAGIYVIQCTSQGQKVLDIGIAGIGMYKDSQGLQRRLKSHDRKSCWDKNCKNEILIYFVMYFQGKNEDELLSIEGRLRNEYKPLCGDNL
jgi:hypothetical protein